MSEPFIGELRLVSFNFVPRGWARCDGQLLSINQNQALFALLGTMYGGNGVTTFALPNLQGRTPISFGQGPGLPAYTQGSSAGSASHQLTTSELPSHTHSLAASTALGSTDVPTGDVPAAGGSYDPVAAGSLAPSSVRSTGGSQPISTTPPYLALTWAIALVGIFPSSN